MLSTNIHFLQNLKINLDVGCLIRRINHKKVVTFCRHGRLPSQNGGPFSYEDVERDKTNKQEHLSMSFMTA